MNINHVENAKLISPGAGWEEKRLEESDPTCSIHAGKAYKVVSKFEKQNKAAFIAVVIIVAIFAIPTLGVIGALFFIPGVLPQRKYYAIPNPFFDSQSQQNRKNTEEEMARIRAWVDRTPEERRHDTNKLNLRVDIESIQRVIRQAERQFPGHNGVFKIIDAQRQYPEFKEQESPSFNNMSPESVVECRARFKKYEDLIGKAFELFPSDI